jgi:glycosyl transferase family 25
MSFNWQVYRELNPDLVNAGLKTPEQFNRHYLTHAKLDKRDFSIYQLYPDFNPINYKNNNNDLVNLSIAALELHWIKSGRFEKRVYTNDYKTLEEFDVIDKILYINLDSRHDRRNEIEREFIKAKIPINKIERISAIYNERGGLGCTASHIKCLKHAIQNKFNNVLILEDDFNFIEDKSIIMNGIKNILDFNNEWDVIFFSGNILKTIPFNKTFSKAIDVQCASGYLVNSRYYLKLLKNFEDGYKLFVKNNNPPLFAVDIFWKSLQPIDNWYVFNIKLGYQRVSYSDIEKRTVDYRC